MNQAFGPSRRLAPPEAGQNNIVTSEAAPQPNVLADERRSLAVKR